MPCLIFTDKLFSRVAEGDRILDRYHHAHPVVSMSSINSPLLGACEYTEKYSWDAADFADVMNVNNQLMVR